MDTNTYLIKRVLNSHIIVTILVTLTATISTVINSMITGQMLGSDELTAIGFATPVFILMGAISGVFSNGGTIRCARHMGSGDMRKVAQNFTAVTLISVTMGLFFLLACFLCKDILAGVLGAKNIPGHDIKDMTATYIMGLGMAALPFLLQQNLLLYIRMDNDQRLALISMVVIIVINTIFAIWCCSSTDLGLLGIALSISLSNIAGMFVSLLHFRRKGRMLHLCGLRGNGPEIKQIVLAGLPTAINRGSQTFKNMALNAFLVSFSGNLAVLALSIQTNVYQLMIAFSTGYGIVIAMMCGIFYGEKDERAITDTLKVTMKSGVIVTLIAGIIMFIFAEQVAELFVMSKTDNLTDIGMIVECIRFFALSQPTSTACLILLYVYQTVGYRVLSAVISVTRGFGYVVLVSVLFAPVFGLGAVWLSFFIADVLSIVTIAAVIWKKRGTFPRHLSDFVIAPEGAFNTELLCDMSVKNDIDHALNICSKIENALSEHNVSKDKTDRITLCIEEMLCNVIDHAFDDDKEHFIDIRIIRKGEDIIFRMRDDGRPFNPLAADKEGHFGIKIVLATAKSVDYRYSVKLNNLMVTV